MRNLVIVGAGGFGREMFGVAREARGYGDEFEIKGFLDDNIRALDGFSGYPSVIGTISGYMPVDGDVFAVAIGSVAARRKIVSAMEERGGKFATVIHRSAFIGPNVVIGEGAFIAPNVSLTADVAIGRHTSVFHNSSIGHDSSVGDFSHVYAQCSVGGNVKIGDMASIYPGSVVTPRRKIGDGAVVGALSAVFADVMPGTTVLGNPAFPLT